MRSARGRLHAHALPPPHLLLELLLPMLMLVTSPAAAANRPPHIIFILADDLGWNDVGFHGSDEIPTPNIDALAYHGVILNSHYVQPLCTPSRAALLTGKYPVHTGMQHLVILEPEPWGLPLEEALLPQRLRQLGYATHAVGKWHLGFYKRDYTPTRRGFDSFFGFWNGFQDYYNHTVQASFSPFSGFDMRRGLDPDYSSLGRYSTDLFTEEAERIIQRHDGARPLFLYLSHLAPHAGNPSQPLQPPPGPLPDLRHIGDPDRRAYAAMVWRLDESVGRVVSALERSGLLQNSVLVFASDNGAATSGVHANHGSNWPLRGMKGTPWEGGVRGVAAVWSPLFEPRVSNQLMHVVDWMPTLYSAAGGDTRALGRLDGVDVWPALLGAAGTPRRHLLINIDDTEGYAAVRVGRFKYVNGSSFLGFLDGWEGSPGRRGRYNASSALHSPAGRALGRYTKVTEEAVWAARSAALVECPGDAADAVECDSLVEACLFDLEADPCERRNLLRGADPLVAQRFEQLLDLHRRTARPPRNADADDRADPACWNGTWVSWGDLA